MNDIYIVGLTGQSGAGKTTVSRIFKEQGLAVINCDEVSRAVTEQGSACNKELSLIFPDCFDENLTLDRKKMGGVVFADRAKLETLNSVIFPYITAYIENEITNFKNSGNMVVVLDAPTLFESGIDKKCDAIVSVVADESVREERIIARDNLSPQEVKNRFKSQLEQSFFIENSDFVIINNGDMKDIISVTNGVVNKIKENAYGDNKKGT